MSGEFLFDGPPDASRTVALAHGAGALMDSPFMQRIAAGLAGHGLRVARFEFPYMQKRRASLARGGRPDPPQVLIAHWRQAIERLGGAGSLVIGGKSLGGRIASMVADRAGVAGLCCLGYPFHPPGRPERLRTAHLLELETPTLILQGERDPFGTPGEIQGYGLSERIRVAYLGDGDHSFKPRVRSGRTLEQNMAEAIDLLGAFVAAL